MKKIDSLALILATIEETPEGEREVQFIVEYQVSDQQDPSWKKKGRIDLRPKLSEAAGMLFEAYSAINALEGTSYDPGSKPSQEPLSPKELELLEVQKKRFAEYPSPHEWADAEFDARVMKDTTKRDALDAQTMAVKKKYPLPDGVSPSAWAKVKAFFGF